LLQIHCLSLENVGGSVDAQNSQLPAVIDACREQEGVGINASRTMDICFVDSVGAPVAAVAFDFGQWLPYVDHTLSSERHSVVRKGLLRHSIHAVDRDRGLHSVHPRVWILPGRSASFALHSARDQRSTRTVQGW
jgi:hypothetical protein